MFLRLRTKITALAVLVLAMLPAALPAQTTSAGCPVSDMRLVVLGDSLADGLWGAYQRRFARCANFDVVRLTVVSDGLAKSTPGEWLGRYVNSTRGQDLSASDIVVIQIGANDITTIRDGRARESYGSEAWPGLYTTRALQLVSALKQRTAGVIWLGLPVVGKSRLEPGYQTISALQAQASRQAGIPFVDVHSVTTFGTGAFAMNGSFQGRVQQLRASDQVHFTRAGYDYVADRTLRDVLALIAQTDKRAGLDVIELP